MSETKHKCPSSTGWIVGLVIFLLIAVGLGIWLIVLYATGNVGNKEDRLVSLPGAKITALGTSIKGEWGQLENEKDQVTLYISESPFRFADDGTVIGNAPLVQKETKTGSSNSITIGATNNTSYNAMLVATGEGTSHYRIYGPKKVFTQAQANLAGQLFNIRDLTRCDGSVSNTGNYTRITTDVGNYRLGLHDNTNKESASFLVRYASPEADASTKEILCRKPGTTDVVLATWTNDDSTDAPVICPLGSTDCSDSDKIDINNCQWSYNSEPDDVPGENKWCLTSQQSTTTSQTSKQTLCLSKNGKSLAVNSIALSDTWFNQSTGILSLPN